jgi:hypothetical protein
MTNGMTKACATTSAFLGVERPTEPVGHKILYLVLRPQRTTRGQRFPRDAGLLAFEAGCEDYCEREVDEVEWQAGRVSLHLGARRDDPPRG